MVSLDTGGAGAGAAAIGAGPMTMSASHVVSRRAGPGPEWADPTATGMVSPTTVVAANDRSSVEDRQPAARGRVGDRVALRIVDWSRLGWWIIEGRGPGR